MTRAQKLEQLNARIVHCRLCPRLVRYREKVAREKRRAFLNWTYWGRPVPSFGDPQAELLILGLAPAAHGANRTGRMFTGDRAGDFLFQMLHRAGFANQSTSTHCNDGLVLRNAYVTATIRCAPPKNKPTRQEIENCRPYLRAELAWLRPRALLALGRIAFEAYLKLLQQAGKLRTRSAYQFGHGRSYVLPGKLPRLFAAYHPSQQNTQTGRLTPAMFLRVLRQICYYLERD